MADRLTAGDIDRPSKALSIFSHGRCYRIDPWSQHSEQTLLHNGSPNGANVGVGTHNGNEVGLAVPSVFNFSNKPIQSKAYSCGGVLHSLGVFENAEAFVGILHDFLSWGTHLVGEVAWVMVERKWYSVSIGRGCYRRLLVNPWRLGRSYFLERRLGIARS